MKGGMSLIVIGGIITIMGMIFHLQGQSIVGPESSFMYANPQWVTYGIQIMVFGVMVLAVGIFWIVKRN